MKVDVENFGPPLLRSTSVPKGNETTTGDAERSLATETPRSLDSHQPTILLLSPRSASNLLPESFGPFKSHPNVLADVGDHLTVDSTPARLNVPRQPSPPNEFELGVFPDKHCVINDNLLKCTLYIINVKHMVLICTDCRYCILPDRALEHLRREHPHCKVETRFSGDLNRRFPDLVAEAIHPPETIGAVFGLAIPVAKYIICSRCRRGYVNDSTWKHHDCKNADTTLAGQPPHFRSHVQTFFRGPRTCYFPVELPKPTSDGISGDDFDLFTTSFQEPAASDGEIHEPDYRELNQFLLKEGWIRHVAGFSSPDLSALTSLPNDGEDLRPVYHDVFALMSNIQAGIGAAGYHVRRLLGRRPA